MDEKNLCNNNIKHTKDFCVVLHPCTHLSLNILTDGKVRLQGSLPCPIGKYYSAILLSKDDYYVHVHLL